MNDLGRSNAVLVVVAVVELGKSRRKTKTREIDPIFFSFLQISKFLLSEMSERVGSTKKWAGAGVKRRVAFPSAGLGPFPVLIKPKQVQI